MSQRSRVSWYFRTATNCTLDYGRSIDTRRRYRYRDCWVIREMEPLLQARNLTVRYGSEGVFAQPAVSGVCFEIGSGEVVGLVGESGCGKTSLALALVRLHPMQSVDVSGSVQFRGKELLTLDERSLEEIRGAKISFVSQEPGIALCPVLRVGDQIAEVLHAHNRGSWKRCRAEAESWLARVDLHPTKRFFSAYPHQLSGGQLQRIVLAQALACGPALLIADEPTAALDGRNQAEFLALLRSLKEQIGLSVLLINHSPEIQASLADRLLVMKTGEIVEQGSFAQLYHSASHPYTRAMLRRNSPEPARESRVPQLVGGVSGVMIERSEIILCAQNLGKHYVQRRPLTHAKFTVQAFQDVNLSIYRGTTLAIVGESGAGKSSLVRCLALLEAPTQGEIWCEGQNALLLRKSELFPIRRKVQLVFQDPASALNPRFTAGEIVAEPLLIQRIGTKAEQRERALGLMEQVGLPPKWERKFPFEFSGGQRQRLAIARALALEPKLLIFDEVLSNLDLANQEIILQLLNDLQRARSLTYIHVCHDLRIVSRIADEVAVMHAGRIVEQKLATELFAKPGDPYTKELFEAMPSIETIAAGRST